MHTRKCLCVAAWITMVHFVFAAPAAAAPDLIVTSVLGPKIGTIDKFIDVAADIKNQGNTAAGGSFRLKFYLSLDPTITTGDLNLGAYCDYPNIAAGETLSTCGGSIWIPNWFSPGTYYLGAVVDANGQIVESNELNNSGVAPDTITLSLSGVDAVSTPNTPSGPGSGTVGITYQFSTGGSVSSLGHQVQYRFDFGDGTDSGWLPVGQTTASKFWASGGNFQVKAQARCASEPSVVSAWSASKTIVIGLPPLPAPWAWVSLPYIAPNWALSGLSFSSPTEGWAVGWGSLTAPRGNMFFHYSGGPWNYVVPPAVSVDYVLFGADFISPNDGWAVGLNEANSTGATIHYSGGNWTPVMTPNLGAGVQWQLKGVSFPSSGEGWAVGHTIPGTSGIILHYSGGAWTHASYPPGPALYSVHFASASDGWAVGSGGTLLHYSGGAWSSVTPPSVSSNWGLHGVHLTSPDEGWGVGRDGVNKRGVLLHWSGDTWSSVNPPNVSADWDLKAVHFISPDEGWAVGSDYANDVGVLLHYSAGKWTSVAPTPSSANWFLTAVHFTSAGEGWAAGGDGQQGLLLHYSIPTYAVTFNTNPSGLKVSVNGIEHTTPKTFYWPAGAVHTVSAPSPQTSQAKQYNFASWSDGGAQTHDITVLSQNASYTAAFQQQPEAVSKPSFLTGPASGETGISYTYSTGGSTSSLGHAVEYQFDWKGDFSDLSPWGSATQSKTWSSTGIYSVRARARCATDPSVMSAWSDVISVSISAPPMETVSPPTFISGPTSGSPGAPCSYSTGGSTSSLGHSLQYQFDWKGDGSDLSAWGSSSQSKTWSALGLYHVRTRARCQTDTGNISQWSSSLAVNISAVPAPDFTGQWVSLTRSCRITSRGNQCKVSASLNVQNIGDMNASSTVFVRFYLSGDNTFTQDDTYLKQVSAGKLKKGTNKKITLNATLPVGLTVSGKYVIAVIDPQNVMPESNESNNEIVYGPIP